MASLSRVMITAGLTLLTLGSVLSAGCEGTGKAGVDVAPVKVKGQTFFLELASDGSIRNKGLGQRTFIEDNGGMLFVFPGKEQEETFVMRDCAIAIDVLFTDASGRVVSMHAMQPEAPRGEKEGNPGDQNINYETRLKKYSSGFPCQFAVELKGGTIAKLGAKVGDKLDFDARGLKERAH